MTFAVVAAGNAGAAAAVGASAARAALSASAMAVAAPITPFSTVAPSALTRRMPQLKPATYHCRRRATASRLQKDGVSAWSNLAHLDYLDFASTKSS